MPGVSQRAQSFTGGGSAEGARAAGRRWDAGAGPIRRSRRSVAEQALDEHAVLPAAVEAPVAALDADFLKAGGQVSGAAGSVVGEDPARELVEAARGRLLAECLEQP